MKSPFGLYRINFGSEPVEASYDYETHKIGPFNSQIELPHGKSVPAMNTIPIDRYYRILQRYKEAIAVWNVNNSIIAMLTPNFLQYCNPDDCSFTMGGDDLSQWRLPNPIGVPAGVHIGWVRTICKTKQVYHYPWHLFYSEVSKRFLDMRFAREQVIGTPKQNPPMSLYKELLNTDYNAVYVDADTDKPIFMKGDF